jgi:hypothetical protein
LRDPRATRLVAYDFWGMSAPDGAAGFGARFLATLRSDLGATLFDYAQAQKIKAMGRDEILKALREHAGADYATIQRAKECDEPEELAHMLAERVRVAQQQMQAALLFSLLI